MTRIQLGFIGLALAASLPAYTQLPLNQKAKLKKEIPQSSKSNSSTYSLKNYVGRDSLVDDTTIVNLEDALKQAKKTKNVTAIDSIQNMLQFARYEVDTFFTSQSTWGVTGIGNLADASQKNLNGSGSVQGYLKPLQLPRSQLQIDLAFIKNASNTDTLLATTLLFPETGSNTFYGRAIWEWEFIKRQRNKYNNYTNHHLLQFYTEVYAKTINQSKDTLKQFSAFSYTFGANYSFLYKEKEGSAIAFSIGPYLSTTKIPENSEDNYYKSFAANIDSTYIPTKTYVSWGMLVQLQINDFSIYADFRDPINSDKLPKSLRGLQVLVGVRFNANIF